MTKTSSLPPLFDAVYICGIGGIGMSGVALLLVDLACHVIGSDLRCSVITQMLEARGVEIAYAPVPARVSDASVVIAPNSFSKTHPEIAEAERRNIPVLTRTQALAQLCGALDCCVTLCFGTTARAKLSRFARFLPDAGWCAGAACFDGSPHAKIGKVMFLDMDEREFFDHPGLWDAFPNADVVVSDWQNSAFQYYPPNCTLQAFIDRAKQRPSPKMTIYPISANLNEMQFCCMAQASSHDVAFEVRQGCLFSSIIQRDFLLYGTFVDAGATAAACTWFDAYHLALPDADINCIGWYNRLSNGQYHDIRMHPVNIQNALRTLANHSNEAPIAVAIKPFVSTLFAYSADIWAKVFKPVQKLYIITPPYEGCTHEDCCTFCKQLLDSGLDAQCVHREEANRISKGYHNWLWIGAPDIVQNL